MTPLYWIRKANQQDYGPFTSEQLQRLILEGQAFARTLARLEGGTDWRELSQYPEFKEALAAGCLQQTAGPVPALLPLAPSEPASPADATSRSLAQVSFWCAAGCLVLLAASLAVGADLAGRIGFWAGLALGLAAMLSGLGAYRQNPAWSVLGPCCVVCICVALAVIQRHRVVTGPGTASHANQRSHKAQGLVAPSKRAATGQLGRNTVQNEKPASIVALTKDRSRATAVTNVAGGAAGPDVPSSKAQADEIPPALVKADQLATGGHFEEAIVEVQRQIPALTQTTDQARAHEMLGDLMLMLPQGGAGTNAASHYRSALALTPQVGRLHFKKAYAIFPMRGYHEEAVAALQRSLELGYTNADTFYLLGSAAKMEGDAATNGASQIKAYTTALHQFSQALKVDPKHLPALGNMADIGFNTGLYEQAAEMYQRMLTLEPSNYVVMLRMGHTLTRLGNFKEATAMFEQAQREYAKAPLPAGQVAKANHRIEGVRLRMYQAENHAAAGRTTEAAEALKAVQAGIAELRKEFSSPQLDEWDRYAAQALERLKL